MSNTTNKSGKFTKSQWFLLIAVCSAAFGLWGDSTNTVALTDIYAEFSNSSAFLQNYIVSGGYIVAIPVMFIVAKYADVVSKKNMLLFGLALSLIGGVGGAFAPTLAIYAVCRTLVCVCGGIIMSAGYGMIFEGFPSANDSAKVMGIYQSVNMAYGTVFSAVAGVVCVAGWRKAQLLNAIPLISVVMVLMFAKGKGNDHSGGADADVPQDAGDEVYREKTDWLRVVLTICEMCLFHLLCFVFNYYNALYVDERGIGTAALAGILVSCMTLGSVFVNMVFGVIYKYVQRYTGAILAVICGISTLLLGFDIPVWMVIALTLVMGVACGGMTSFYPVAVNQYVANSQMGLMQSIFQGFSLGVLSITAFVPSVYMSIFNGGYQDTMFQVGVTIAALGVVFILLIKTVVNKK